MNQLIAHLIGDYWLQTSWMAFNKEKSWAAAGAHVFMYMSVFAAFHILGFFSMSIPAFAVIGGTHLLIDRFGLMKRLCLHLNDLNKAPESLKIWLPIIWDNTAHLTINFLALYYL